VDFVKRSCVSAHSARPIAAIDGAVTGREASRGSKAVAPVFARWVSGGELQRGFCGGDGRIGCRDGSAGGAHLRFFSSGTGEAESG
jgi:hypothetical protein